VPVPRADGEVEMRKKTLNFESLRELAAQRPTLNVQCTDAFTLIELLVVISIIAILIGLLFPAFRSVLNQARKTQAKNDLMQIIIAVNGYYTEYGKYPLNDTDQGTEKTFASDNSNLLYALQAIALGDNAGNAINPRRIAFLHVQEAKDQTNPRSGIRNGTWYDPWGATAGKPESGIYHVTIDGDYADQVSNPYVSNAGPPALQGGVIAWSLGKDGTQGTNDFRASDDVISWQ
jgi:prepilin-type N-terminal cleavage/methylation domain-containing protein